MNYFFSTNFTLIYLLYISDQNSTCTLVIKSSNSFNSLSSVILK
nr:MAG TPA: hypothetical protein [Caudoviricetes sp.]